mmetsp:Transcript_50838/g.80575  ORF Transcript_50838/g.80575 Transcript_50838/m.80575 type:complete len:631 (-) Transcript_50838:122-2014(-)
MESVEDQFHHIRTEWNVLKEKWFHGETVDPVFEGMVKDFCNFDTSMQDIYKKVEVFMKGVDSLSEGLLTLSESVTSGLARVDDSLIVSDSCKLKEATNQITRADAPHSAIAKLRRDMDFNIVNPIRNHLINNRNLKAHLDKRRRRLTEFNSAKKAYDDCVKKNLQMTDRRFLQAKSNLESAKMSFHEVDKHVFEWLYILEEYRGDILDSTLQTLKYLQYEFFATSAHAVSSVLPSRMEFRPMVEMTPEHLEAQVEVELQEAEDAEEDVVTDFSVRLIEKLAKDNKNKPGEGLDSCKDDAPALPVDPLSLSSLLSQGFDEGPARRALRLHQNNTQEALDWLINGGTEGSEAAKVAQLEDGVRMPTTIKRIQKLKAMRRAQQDKLRREESRNNAAEEDRRTREIERKAADSSADEEDPPPKPRPAAKKTAQALDLIGFDNPPPAQSSGAQDLLSLDEPPPPMDFTRDIETSALPEMRSFDPTMCEKPPLAASVTAGTALPRRDSGDKNNDVMALMSLQAPTQPAVSSLSSTGGGYSSQTSAVDVAQLAAQANISPQQLLAAAQQLAAQQQQQQQQTLQPAVFNGGSGLDTLGGMSQAALNALSQKPATSATTTATPLDSLASLDPLSGGELF